MSGLDTMQIILVGASTGFGSALGAELARYLVEFLRDRKRAIHSNELKTKHKSKGDS